MFIKIKYLIIQEDKSINYKTIVTTLELRNYNIFEGDYYILITIK